MESAWRNDGTPADLSPLFRLTPEEWQMWRFAALLRCARHHRTEHDLSPAFSEDAGTIRQPLGGQNFAMSSQDAEPPASAEALARRLVASAPTGQRLLQRDGIPAGERPSRPPAQHSLHEDPRLYELASLALASARRAEEATRQLRRARTAARRTIWTAGIVIAGTIAACALALVWSGSRAPEPIAQSAQLAAMAKQGPQLPPAQPAVSPTSAAAEPADGSDPRLPPDAAPAALVAGTPAAPPKSAFARARHIHHRIMPPQPLPPPVLQARAPDGPAIRAPTTAPPFLGYSWGGGG